MNLEEGTMSESKTSQIMSPGLARVAARAQQDPQARLRALAHHLDEAALRRAYHRIRKDAAVGVDGITKEAYGQNLQVNLQELHERLRKMQYRHQPIRRIYIPKDKGKRRPIGVSTIEDKIVQGALHELLQACYEPMFSECSYGFRPGRKAHDALRSLDRAVQAGQARWILEFDVQSFFDSMDRPMLKEMLQQRIADKSLMRLIGKCLNVGVLDGEHYESPERGTVQGSVLSPTLGNIYLHHVLDRWFEQEVKPRLRGKAMLVRYADDGLFGFERRDDAKRVIEVLRKRMARFGLELHPDKTRLMDFRRPSLSHTGRKGPSTFDFLGFTLYWRRSRDGHWVMTCKTQRASLRRAIRSVHDFCRRHRHEPVKEQHAALARRLRGHFNYFGVRGNESCLFVLRQVVKTTWHKWLNRRSQRSRMTWKRFKAFLKDYPLPRPQATASLWGMSP
jgi:RNA-directed DNA polymerase